MFQETIIQILFEAFIQLDRLTKTESVSLTWTIAFATDPD